MRESIGGTWLFQIAIVFILLFAGYLALSVNYSRAFKVKNEIISIIERNEGPTTKAQSQITQYLGTVNHTVVGKCETDETAFMSTHYGRGAYCLKKTCVDGHVISRAYYKVTVFFKFDLPVVGDLFTFRVVGETKVIYKPEDNSLTPHCS